MVAKVLKKVFMVDLLIGLSVTLRNQFRPHVTEEYPRETPDLAPRFRGVPRLRRDPETGEELCIACLLCMKICPDNCFEIVPERHPDGKGKRPLSFIIDYERCCFCGLCVDPCPTKPITAIYMSHDYELAGENREEFIVRKDDLMNGKPIKGYRS
ncbi:MAG: NADH-quinone oxidoreductase subunit I [Acidobacteriota bacterium]